MHLLTQLITNFHARRYTTVGRTAGGVKDGEIAHREYWSKEHAFAKSKINV